MQNVRISSQQRCGILLVVKKDITLPDGRVLCKVCMSIAIKSGDSIEAIKTNVINTLSKVGFDDLRVEDISIEIVSAQRLAEIRKSPVNLQIKGLTLSMFSASMLGLFTGKNQTFRHTIYILTHLTKVEFAGVLAHEMLHAWQTQNGIEMPPKQTEGLCNMGAYLMYNRLPSSLTKIHLKTLHESPDPIYGDGFREMHALYKDVGWKELIQMIRNKQIKT